MNAKELLKSDQPLCKWWSSIVGDSKFDRMMLILKADSFERNPSPEQQSGITQFIAGMESIVNPDEPQADYAAPGLNHNLDTVRKTVEPEKPKPSKKK